MEMGVQKKNWWKNESGKKAWCVLKNMEKKPCVFFSKHITINDEVEVVKILKDKKYKDKQIFREIQVLQ